MLWQMMGVVLASATIAVVFRIDQRDEGAKVDEPADKFRK
jgi:hypothetical protein